MLSVKKSNRRFFESFESMANGSVEASRILEEMFRNGASTFAASADRIKEIEHRCDTVVHGLVKDLNSTFITPIDREDIHDLGTSLDDMVDLIDASASRAVLFKVGSEVPDAARLAGVIHREALEILAAVGQLRDVDATLARCRRINDLEHEADGLFKEAMRRLFESGRDPIFIIKAKDIIEMLEAATDAGERIAIVLERIVLKNQ